MAQTGVRVLVLHAQAAYYKQALETRFPGLDILAAVPEQPLPDAAFRADAIVTLARSVSDDTLARFTRLRWVQALTSGTDGFLALRHLPAQAVLTSARGIHGPAVSEMALMHMMALSRDYPRLLAQQRQHIWQRTGQPLLHGKTVVMVGTGVIACALALKCQAMGMQTIGVSGSVRGIAGFDEVVGRQQLPDAARRADFLVATVPLDDTTRHLISAGVFEAMKPSAYFVDVSRGGVCDEAALLKALQSGRIAGAALDVFETEPLPADHPLWDAPHTIITPHLAGESDHYADQVMPIIETNLACLLEGRMDQMVNRVPRTAHA